MNYTEINQEVPWNGENKWNKHFRITPPLADEINNFYRERERIRDAIGRIGGIQYSRADTIVNIIFIILVVGFFSIELVFKPLPTTVSIEIGVFLVSMKIVWMIHANQKFNHFVFWVLNSLEFRMNTNTRLLEDLEKKVDLLQK